MPSRSKGQEIRFTRGGAPWRCPCYKSYYILERFGGRDIYGNETYEYALFHKQPYQVVQRFRTRRQAYEYVSRRTGLTRWDIKMGSVKVVINDREYLGVIYGNIMYRISRRTREVAIRPLYDKQLTRWHMKYVDCLSEAKEIIQRLEEVDHDANKTTDT